MFLLKKKVLTSVVSLVLVLSSPNLIESQDKGDNKKVTSAYENLISQNKIECIKSTNSDGEVVITYTDTENSEERVDTYNKDGILTNRDLLINKGGSVIKIELDKENGTYKGVYFDVDSDVKDYNQEVLSVSSIKKSFEYDQRASVGEEWSEKESTITNVNSYVSKSGNIYIDTENNIITKREIVEGNEIIESIEYDILSPSTDLFKLDSPVLGNNNIDLIKQADITKI